MHSLLIYASHIAVRHCALARRLLENFIFLCILYNSIEEQDLQFNTQFGVNKISSKLEPLQIFTEK